MADLLVLTLSALLTGFYIGWVLFHPPQGTPSTRKRRQSLTRILFAVLTACPLIWIFWCLALATYATVVLGQVYTLSELVDPAINGLLGMTALKVTENIFEHNDGGLFGHSRVQENVEVYDADIDMNMEEEM